MSFFFKWHPTHIDVLVQERHNSSELAMELCLSCTNPSTWPLGFLNVSIIKNLDPSGTVDALAPSISRLSVAMVLTTQDKQLLIFHKEGFPLPVPSHQWEMIEKCKYIFIIPKINLARQG